MISDKHLTNCDPDLKSLIDIKSSKRHVFIMPWFEGIPLDAILTEEGIHQYEAYMDDIVLQCAKQLLKAHETKVNGCNIIHGDVANSQFIVHIKDFIVSVRLIDFGNAILMPENKTNVLAFPRTTAAYAAPEIMNGEYSQASDCFGFGRLLEEFPQMETNEAFRALVDQLTDEDPENRPSMAQVVTTLASFISEKQQMDKNHDEMRGKLDRMFL